MSKEKSRVFGAKRSEAEIEYEFIDGTVVTLKVRSLSSRQQKESSFGVAVTLGTVIDKCENALRQLFVKNEKKIVDQVIKEQYDEGDIIELKNEMDRVIQQAKAKKLQDS